MAGKVIIMVLSVDLQCSKCRNEVKKLLCKFPEIRDQMYDEKANKVTIKVVSFSPEKIRDKLCYKRRGYIKSIEIIEPPTPKPPPPPEKPTGGGEPVRWPPSPDPPQKKPTEKGKPSASARRSTPRGK